MQGLMRIYTDNTEKFYTWFKKAMKASFSRAGDTCRIVLKPFGPSQTVLGMIGYCNKDNAAPYWMAESEGYTAAQIREGIAAYEMVLLLCFACFL